MSDLTYPYEKVEEFGGPGALGAALLAGGLVTVAAWVITKAFDVEFDASLAVAIALTVSGIVMLAIYKKKGSKIRESRKKGLLMLTPVQLEIVWAMLTNKSGCLVLRKSNPEAAGLRSFGVIYIPNEMTYTPPDGYEHFLNPEMRMPLMEDREIVVEVYRDMTGEDLKARKSYRDPRL